MPNDSEDDETVIRENLIRETVMPAYEFQEHQYGFGSINSDQPAVKKQSPENPLAATNSEKSA